MHNFCRNRWYAAVESSELTDNIVTRTIMNEPVLLTRNQEKMPVALMDQCPHRFYPLSQGQRDCDILQCRYHGLRFDLNSGHCVDIPTQDTIPDRAHVRTYPLFERYGFISCRSANLPNTVISWYPSGPSCSETRFNRC